MTRIGARLPALSLAFALTALSAGVFAQEQQPRETMPSQTDSHSEGTAPGGMGSTGWTGGTGGAHIGTSNAQTTGSGKASAASVEGQPWMATGLNLEGPPTRFAPDNTPE